MSELDVAAMAPEAADRERLAGLPKWTPPAVDIDLTARPIAIHLNPGRLDLAAAERAGRERIHKALAEARDTFQSGELYAEVLRLRERRIEAEARLADGRKLLAAIEADHQTAAAAGSAEAGRTWKKVLTHRDEVDGCQSAVTAVSAALQQAEGKATTALAAVIDAARNAEAAAIRSRRQDLQTQLLDAVRPLLEALAAEDAAASALRLATQNKPALPPA
jgi:hypothetical protein